MAVVFALLKEKAAKMISGFNEFSGFDEEKRAGYDQERMSRDMRNRLLLWAAVLFIGGVLSLLFSSSFAIGAYVVWLILLFKDVHLDEEKAFGKYRLKK
jgi:hypothetical protein